jgi:hypothetical protein
VRTAHHLVVVSAVALLLFSGCGRRTPLGPASGEAEGPHLGAADTQASQQIGGRLSTLINDATIRYRPLDYDYDEDLLAKLDQVEAYLSGKTTGSPPRFLPKLDEQEELDHLRETIGRWQARTGKNLRAEVDKLKAEVGARKPGERPFHPEFHKHFSAAFDDLTPIEVAEIRERRNKYIHDNATPIFDEYREKHPAAVREHEATLNKPPYDLARPEPAGKTS